MPPALFVSPSRFLMVFAEAYTVLKEAGWSTWQVGLAAGGGVVLLFIAVVVTIVACRLRTFSF